MCFFTSLNSWSSPFFFRLSVKDVAVIVEEYLADARVLRKNTDRVAFNTSIQVFVHLQQTPLDPALHINSDIVTLETTLLDIQERFKTACSTYKEWKRAYLASKQAAKWYDRQTSFDMTDQKSSGFVIFTFFRFPCIALLSLTLHAGTGPLKNIIGTEALTAHLHERTRTQPDQLPLFHDLDFQ